MKASIDRHLGLDWQARGVLAYVCRKAKDALPEGVTIQTAAWYNGRERGVVFYYGGLGGGPCLCIAVFEHRNSDQICALRWVREGYPFNPPTMASDGELAYPTDNKYDDIVFQVECGKTAAMGDWVLSQYEEFCGAPGPAHEVGNASPKKKKSKN